MDGCDSCWSLSAGFGLLHPKQCIATWLGIGALVAILIAPAGCKVLSAMIRITRRSSQGGQKNVDGGKQEGSTLTMSPNSLWESQDGIELSVKVHVIKTKPRTKVLEKCECESVRSSED